jgi:transglutaminase-like putative cysteine protease
VIYDVAHITTYRYEAPVASATCTLRLTPMQTLDQAVLSSAIDVQPAPAARRARTGFFGVRSEEIRIDISHRELRIEARSRVEVQTVRQPSLLAEPPWDAVRQAVARSDSLAPASPVHHLFPSPFVAFSGEMTRYAARSFPAGRGIVEGALDLMRRIKADFVYDPRATQVTTLPVQAFERRRGVCQDFAHVMIAGLRGLGLPAAYVSGYIRTTPIGGRRLQGADATHAWVSLWCGPDIGWIGLDPTNGVRAGDDHIQLAVGRDYADVAPVTGIILGSGAQRLTVAVDVIPLRKGPAAA